MHALFVLNSSPTAVEDIQHIFCYLSESCFLSLGFIGFIIINIVFYFIVSNLLFYTACSASRCTQGFHMFLSNTKIIKPSINLVQFYTFELASPTILSYILFLFPCSFLTLYDQTGLFPSLIRVYSVYFQKLHPVSQAVFSCALNTPHHTHISPSRHTTTSLPCLTLSHSLSGVWYAH